MAALRSQVPLCGSNLDMLKSEERGAGVIVLRTQLSALTQTLGLALGGICDVEFHDSLEGEREGASRVRAEGSG